MTKRTLTETEVKAVVDQWTGNRSVEELNEQVVKKEIEKLEKKLERYIPRQWEAWTQKKRRCRILTTS